MPPHSSDSSVWVCVDANAVIDYTRECTLRDLRMPPTSRKQVALRNNLDQVCHAFVAATAGVEAQENLAKDMIHKLGRLTALSIMDYADDLLYDYLRKVECADSSDYVSAAREMYNLISSDPGNQKHYAWRKKKGMFVVDPVLGSDKNDLVILSTAADYAQRYTVELWTHDRDFTMFADEIQEVFDVKVVDTYSLPEHSHS